MPRYGPRGSGRASSLPQRLVASGPGPSRRRRARVHWPPHKAPGRARGPRPARIHLKLEKAGQAVVAFPLLEYGSTRTRSPVRLKLRD